MIFDQFYDLFYEKKKKLFDEKIAKKNYFNLTDHGDYNDMDMDILFDAIKM